MGKYTYYLFNLSVFLPVFTLSLLYKVKLLKQWQNFTRAFLLVSVPFVIWDMWAASRGHWLFSDTYVTSFRLVHIPVEEALFFVSVPFAMMYVWLVLLHLVNEKPKKPTRLLRTGLLLLSVLFVLLSVLMNSKGYTFSVLLAMGFTLFVLSQSSLLSDRRFWYFQAIALVLFVLCNTFLTVLPVISYGAKAIIGYRVGTIPVEDFMYNFSLLTLFLLVFNRGKLLTKST